MLFKFAKVKFLFTGMLFFVEWERYTIWLE